MRHTEAALVEALGALRVKLKTEEDDARSFHRQLLATNDALELAARRTGELVLERDKLTQEVARLRGEAARVSVDLERCTKERDAARADARRLATPATTQTAQ